LKRVAFIFPGQGSQYSGMFEKVKEYQTASFYLSKYKEILGYSFEDLSDDELLPTNITQPAIYTMSAIYLKILEDKGIKPFMLAGHSLGEFSALLAGGCYSFEDGLRIVSYRGLIMKNATKDTPGTMAAIIGINNEKIKNICLKSSHIGIVEPANYNSLEQIVISGEVEAVNYACDLAKKEGAKLTKILNVSAPFHSSLMLKINKVFENKLEEFNIKNSNIPIVQNYDANIHQDSKIIKRNLVYQLSSPVLWDDSIEQIRRRGATEFVEIGPRKVLTNLCKSNKIVAYSSEDLI